MTPPIAILGGGPAGLLLARLLTQAGIEYVVFERDTHPSARRQGGSLDLHVGTGQLALERAGLMDAFRARARYAGATTTFADKAGAVAASFSPDEAGGEGDRPEIDRGDLRALLLAAMPAERVRWGAAVEGVERDAETGLMCVKLVGGEVHAGFRLVVGADGTWSKARGLLTSARPQHFGRCFLMTTISADNPFSAEVKATLGRGTYMGMSDMKQIVAQYMGDDSFVVYVGLPLPENWTSENASLLKDAPALRQWFLEHHFTDWATINTDLIRKSDGDFVPWVFYTTPIDSLPWKSVPGVTLIGDAAYVTIPDGEGANSALYEALQLGEQIVQLGLDHLDEAVAAYEKALFPRAVERITQSTEFGKQIFAPDSPQSFVKEHGFLNAEEAS